MISSVGFRLRSTAAALIASRSASRDYSQSVKRKDPWYYVGRNEAVLGANLLIRY